MVEIVDVHVRADENRKSQSTARRLLPQTQPVVEVHGLPLPDQQQLDVLERFDLRAVPAIHLRHEVVDESVEITLLLLEVEMLARATDDMKHRNGELDAGILGAVQHREERTHQRERAEIHFRHVVSPSKEQTALASGVLRAAEPAKCTICFYSVKM